jgi:transposase
MRLTNHDLKQIDHDYLATLSPEQLLNLSGKMLDDLRDARDRLNQTPQNSSRPSGSYAPWEQATFSDKEKESDAPDETATTAPPPKEKEKPESDKPGSDKEDKGQRKAGKQPGSKGVGRRVELAVTGEVVHQPLECAACGHLFAADVPFQKTTGRYVLDIEQVYCKRS